MPYCKTAYLDIRPESVEEVLSALAQECFVGGRAAYQLDNRTFSIDAGENDVRAIYSVDETTIRFYCRRSGDMEFYDNKLQRFASKHALYSQTL